MSSWRGRRAVQRAGEPRRPAGVLYDLRDRHRQIGIRALREYRYDRAERPLTDIQLCVFGALRDEPKRCADIAAVAGLSTAQVASAARYLAGKHLAVKVGRGMWRRATAS